MREFFATLQELIYPITCELCSAPGISLCISCSSHLSSSAHLLSGFTFPVAAGIVYDDRTASIVLRAKENGARNSYRALSVALSSALEQIAPPRKFALIPIPSTAQSLRRRGRNFIVELAEEFCRMHKARYDISLSLLLRHSRNIRDQSGLSMNERVHNMNGAFIQQQICREPALIFDDVVTTGSTVNAAFSALSVANTTIIGAIAACASPQQMRIPYAGGSDPRQNLARRRRPNS